MLVDGWWWTSVVGWWWTCVVGLCWTCVVGWWMVVAQCGRVVEKQMETLQADGNGAFILKGRITALHYSIYTTLHCTSLYTLHYTL